MYEPVEIYEVEEWGDCPTDICATDSYSEYFTTLEEAKQHFDDVALYVNDIDICDISEWSAKKVFYTGGCTLRKLRVDLVSENPVSLDRDIVQTLKEVTVKTEIIIK